jgi:hypothetical protein
MHDGILRRSGTFGWCLRIGDSHQTGDYDRGATRQARIVMDHDDLLIGYSRRRARNENVGTSVRFPTRDT